MGIAKKMSIVFPYFLFFAMSFSLFLKKMDGIFSFSITSLGYNSLKHVDSTHLNNILDFLRNNRERPGGK